MTDSSQTTHKPSLFTRMLIGAIAGLILISVFLLKADEPDPAWGKYWMIRPIIMMAFAGAMAGLCNYYLLRLHKKLRMSKTLAIIASIVISLAGLFIGFVLGLDGTMWN
jgi:drug/metabolite transporter (DMT)-like permease